MVDLQLQSFLRWLLVTIKSVTYRYNSYIVSQLRWLHIQLGQLLTDISVTRRVSYRLQAGLQLKWVTGGAGRRFHGKSGLVWSGSPAGTAPCFCKGAVNSTLGVQ